jgi:hypothetical protein
VDTDDPKNVTNILCKTMTEDSGTWKALAYLEECKSQYSGFDYHVCCYDKEGMPNSILWMDSQMPSNLIHLGDILCLDVQKHQYNCSGFPYCSPIAKDGDFHAAQCAESIIVEKTDEVYAWILKSMKALEPRWDMSKLWIIFGDQHVSRVILQKLNIEESGTLCGDYYHLYNKV